MSQKTIPNPTVAADTAGVENVADFPGSDRVTRSAPILPRGSSRRYIIRHRSMLVVSLCCLAFLLRAGVGFLGPDHFWAYGDYFRMASVVASGGGYCLNSDSTLCAYFPPVYPTILAGCVLTNHVRPAMTLVGAVLGAGTVWMTFLTGRLLAGTLPGLLACMYAAIYPFYVWHDTVIQENAALAFVVSVTVFALVAAKSARSVWRWVAAGCMLGICVLTKANLATFLPLAVLWTGIAVCGSWRYRLRTVLSIILGVMLVLGPWFIRTWRIVGAPVLYSNGGFSLWTSNHRLTFDYFPGQSIDAAALPEWNDLPLIEQEEIHSLQDRDPQGIQPAKWYWRKGMAFITAHPWLTVKRALYKIWTGFSLQYSPAKGFVFQAVYLAFYLPLFVLAGPGSWLIARRRWPHVGYVFMLILSFAGCCAVFWGHTSHRMYLEPYLMIFAAYAACNYWAAAWAKLVRVLR